MTYGGRHGGDPRPPLIDSRDMAAMVAQMKRLVPYYTPEWRFSPEDPDAGTTLFFLAADMLQDTIKRLNQVQVNHFLSFLDLMQVRLAPMRPSRSAVVFGLAEGASEPVLVPEGFKLTAEDPAGGDPLEFETERALLVTPARIAEWVNVHPGRDRIVFGAQDYSEALAVGTAGPVRLYDVDAGENVQEHVFYVRHDELFLLDHPCRLYLQIQHTEKQYSEPATAAALASGLVVWEYPCGGEWVPFGGAAAEGSAVVLHKTGRGLIQPVEIGGETGRWIRCRVRELAEEASPVLAEPLEMNKLRVRVMHDAALDPQGIPATGLHFNEAELTRDGFLPFGDQFLPYAVFYVSCEEAFSKRESVLRFSFDARYEPTRTRMAPDPEVKWKMVMRTSQFEDKPPQQLRIRAVVWEYWNGGAWAALPGGERYTGLFAELPETAEQQRRYTLEFVCPTDLNRTFVGGKHDYWIRARVLQVDPVLEPIVEYMSPRLAAPSWSYRQPSQAWFMPDGAATANNADLCDRTPSARQGGEPYRLFEPVPVRHPAVYAGFDAPPVKGPLRLHVTLERRPAPHAQPPMVEWEALCRDGGRLRWLPLKVVDGTDGFSAGGELQFVGPPTIASARLFGRERYWLRAVNPDGRYGRRGDDKPVAARLDLNAVSVRQMTSRERELPELKEGVVQLSPTPYIEEEVWVDEAGVHGEHELGRFAEAYVPGVDVRRDSEGRVLHVWVRWQPVETLVASSPDDRHYIADRAGGTLTFGDGVRGMPPTREGIRLIRVRYKTTAGVSGHVAAGQITGMQQPLAYIAGVSNPAPSIGGGDTERIGQVLRRGPQRLKNRGRAVSVRDIEWLAREAYPQIAKVRCLPNRNAALERSPGSLAVVALPAGGYASAEQFPELRRRVSEALARQASSLVSLDGSISVIEPAYLEISVVATVAVDSVDGLLPAEAACAAKLDRFLDAAEGNVDGGGWDIGEPLHSSLLQALLHSVRSVQYIETLYLHVIKIENGVRAEFDPGRLGELPHGIVVNGSHQITAVPAPR